MRHFNKHMGGTEEVRVKSKQTVITDKLPPIGIHRKNNDAGRWPNADQSRDFRAGIPTVQQERWAVST
jgi:hypothetical protein